MPDQSNQLEVNRRGFLKAGSLSMAALGGISFLTSPERVWGANDRVRVGICGLQGRGEAHMLGYSRLHNVEIAALCDIDESVLRERLAEAEKMGLPQPKSYTDVRKLL